MAKKRAVLGMLALGLVFGLVLTSCGETGQALVDALVGITFENDSSETVTVDPEDYSSFSLKPGDSNTIYPRSGTVNFVYRPASVNYSSSVGRVRFY